MTREPRQLIDQLTTVQKLVHLAMRRDTVYIEELRVRLLRIRRNAYEQEITFQAERAGCPGRRGRLTTGPSLTVLSDASQRDAESVANTYNYDLAAAILKIGSEVPTANRYVYAYRLQTWDAKRAGWKTPQIEQYAINEARGLAQRDFQALNVVDGVAVLAPVRAVCPVCQGWANRGEVPLRVATNNPPPYHGNCPHTWDIRLGRVAREECPLLWMGE